MLLEEFHVQYYTFMHHSVEYVLNGMATEVEYYKHYL